MISKTINNNNKQNKSWPLAPAQRAATHHLRWLPVGGSPQAKILPTWDYKYISLMIFLHKMRYTHTYSKYVYTPILKVIQRKTHSWRSDVLNNIWSLGDSSDDTESSSDTDMMVYGLRIKRYLWSSTLTCTGIK